MRGSTNKKNIPIIELNGIIEMYKSIGSWNAVSKKYNYSSDIIKSRVQEYFGKAAYSELIKQYGKHKGKGEIVLEQKEIDDIIEKYKKYRSWRKVSQDIKISRDTIKKILGESKFKELIDKYPHFQKPIPISKLNKIIQDYKLTGSWKKSANKYIANLKLDTIINQITSHIGIDQYNS